MTTQRTRGKSGIACSLALGLLLVVRPVSALAPEHEVRRLMLAVEQAVDAEQWGEAGEYLNRLQSLETPKPAGYLYFRGRVMLEAGHYNEAQSALEGYVSQAGAEGTHYRDALQLITAAEKARRALAERKPSPGEADEPVAMIRPAGEQAIASLRQLYLVDTVAEALTIHLNSLLELSGWRSDQRIVRADAPADVSYQVRVVDGAIHVQEARRDTGNRIVRSTQSIPVYGVSPLVRWDCEPVNATCWVFDPRDGSRLFRLAHDRERAEEIADTLGRLIRALQEPS